MESETRSIVRRALIAAWALGAVAGWAAPVLEKHGEVIVLHGGVGEEDRAAMERRAFEYNLHLTLARKGSGAYLANARVVIRGARDAVLVDTVASGPWLYARLPAGTIVVSVTEGGQTLTQKLTLAPRGMRDWVFRFEPPTGE